MQQHPTSNHLTIWSNQMPEQILTQERLKEVLHYNPDTGVFHRIQSRGGAASGRITNKPNKASGYILIRIDNIKYQSQRIAWLYMVGEWPDEIDHKNHIKHENWWGNLREVTHGDNMKNTSKRKDNTSGITGVHWREDVGRWYASIQNEGQKYFCGAFTEMWDAICARKSAEHKNGFHPNHGN